MTKHHVTPAQYLRGLGSLRGVTGGVLAGVHSVPRPVKKVPSNPRRSGNDYGIAPRAERHEAAMEAQLSREE